MGKRVLAVDDEDQVREFVSAILEENGYVPVLARNGEEAMDIIRKNRPDLIIMDILMPRKSGINLYRELKTMESLREIPVVICSGIARRTFMRSQAAHAEFGEEGVPKPEAYIEKPVKPLSLTRILEKLLG